MTWRARVVRRVLAVLLAVASPLVAAPTPAGAATTDEQHSDTYIATAGADTGCPNETGIGGVCEAIAGPGVVHIEVHDSVSPHVAAYVDIDGGDGRFFCDVTDVALADSAPHWVAVWPGGADTVKELPDCVPGVATTGTVAYTV